VGFCGVSHDTTDSRAPVMGYTIDKGIPLPEAQHCMWDKIISDMEIGDSILLSQENAVKFAGAVYRKQPGFNITRRKQPSGQVRIWAIK